MPKKKTAYEKILPLVQLSPDNPTLRTALRHFGDDVLLREVQRRNARNQDQAENPLNDVDNNTLQKEWAARSMDDDVISALHVAVNEGNWDKVRDAIDELTERNL